jgi:hypothetical protein
VLAVNSTNPRDHRTPFEVAVQLRAIPAQLPTAPQSVGGLWTRQTEWAHETWRSNGCSRIVYDFRVVPAVGKVAMENFNGALPCILGQGEWLADVELAELRGDSWNKCKSDKNGKVGGMCPPSVSTRACGSPFSMAVRAGRVTCWKKTCDNIGVAAV